MRTNHSGWSRLLGSVVMAVAAFGLAASNAAAQTTVHLIAAPVMKAITLPNGTTVSVPMWGYAVDTDNSNTVNGTEVVSVPGPRIVVPPGSTSLTVYLTNLLPEATSLVIPGQPFNPTVVRNGDRVRSMTPEATPLGGTATYTFGIAVGGPNPPLKPGTFLYQSGSHSAVQVQMGLYGAMTMDASAGNAYVDVPYAHEQVLLYSEIDTALHAAVQNGTYGTSAGPTSTFDYKPSLFLVNGQSYTNASMATLSAGTVGEATLLRILNAGLRTHTPVLDNGSLKIWAEDGNRLPFAKDQATVLLAAGKTHDALWTPAAAGVYTLYDRTLSLNASAGSNASGQGAAGMLAKLRIAATPESPSDAVIAANDTASGTEDLALGGSVLGNDTPVTGTTAELLTSPHAGTVAFAVNGTFTYTPSPNFFGVDSFTYRAKNGANFSKPATVTISVAGVPDTPVATAQSLGVDFNGNLSVSLSGTDADGDSLAYYVSLLPDPMQGALSYINPTTKVETPLVAADLYSAPTKKAIPGGVVIYKPAENYSGDDSFTFVADDGGLHATAAISLAVHPADEDSPAADLTDTVSLIIKGADGSDITSYRWTLEEDLTYKVSPGVADPNTLAVRFHTSYTPVVASGTDADEVKVNPAKRYFISVLPTENNYSNTGAEIEANTTAVSLVSAKLPLPTARIRVQVFEDNAPLDGMISGTEAGLAGFQVTIDDAGGTYGMSGGHQSTDAFGNKIGTKYQECLNELGDPDPGACDSYQVSSLGDGFVLSDADGFAVIENLPMGKYTVKVRAPGGQRWIQTTTIEGQPGIDAWVKPNEPQFFTEFGPPGPHVLVGFVRASAAVPAGPFRGNGSITGRVTNMRMSRPPETTQSSGAPFAHTRPWVALNSAATAGEMLYTQPVNEDGTFTISNVAGGNYSLVVFDSALDLIIASRAVDVAPAGITALGDMPVFPWFSNLYSFVYEDTNRNGHHDDGEPGISDQALNIRFRDGSIYQSLATDSRGFKAFNEVFPFFAWLIAEVDYTRFHSTGLTVVVDNGGVANTANDWQAQAGLPAGLVPPNILNPQPQAENANKPFREESGAETPFLLLEGFQGFLGQSSVMLWGKAPYETVGSFTEDVNVAPFDDFPGPDDVDANGDGFFNTDRSNGGIAGIVHYTITRAENDPRWAVAENWEAGVSDVRIQLWDADRKHLLNEARTDNWNNSPPEGCQGAKFMFLGRTTDCYDGLRNFNQARPGLFDGGYAFSTILQDAVGSPTYDLPIDQRGVTRPLPAGKYVVKMIPPPGYKVQKEEDKNVDFGDQYMPQAFWLSGYPLADAAASPIATILAGSGVNAAQTTIALTAGDGRNVHPNDIINIEDEILRVTATLGDVITVLRAQSNSLAATHAPLTEVFSHDAQLAPTVNDNALVAPFCVGALHTVPNELSLFSGVTGAFGGEQRPLCDAKLVNLRAGQQAAPDFHLLTDAPKAGHIYGMVLDDTTNEFDANAPTFGEKYAPPFMPIAIRDWQGRQVAHTYSDQYGMYNALVPSTYTIQVPQPSGVSPSILQACINSPTMAGPDGTVIADPLFQKQYSHFCYPLQYLPGKTTYLDTPVLPTGAFTGTGTFPVDAELPDRTPVIASVTGTALGLGPYIVDNGPGDNDSRTIMITSAGHAEVPNPAYDGPGSLQPKLITRDYGFSADGSVKLGGVPLTVTNRTSSVITAIVPSGLRTGELSVENVGLRTCTVTTALRSTLSLGLGPIDGSLRVGIGGGKSIALNTLIQIDAEVMLVTGGNRSTLAAALGNSITGSANIFATNTLLVATGAGAVFAPLQNVSVEAEVIRIDGNSTTALTVAMDTNVNILNRSSITVTANQGLTGTAQRFAVGDVLTIEGEQMTVVGAGSANTYTVNRPGPRANHAAGVAVTASDRFNVTRASNGTVRATHATGLAVIGDWLNVSRGQEGTTAASHALNAQVRSYLKSCIDVDSHKSTLGITLSVATPQMHAARPPKVVDRVANPGQTIQSVIDDPTTIPGDLVIVKPGTYEEMVIMSKPVRLQGTGAMSTVINVVTAPSENVQAWLNQAGQLLLDNPDYLLPNQPAMTPAPFQAGDVQAVIGDEGPGVLVLGKSDPTTLGVCRGGFDSPNNEAYCLHNENYPNFVSPWLRPNARIDGFSLIGANNAPGVLANGNNRYLEVSNNRIYSNSGTYAGGVQLGHPGQAILQDDDADIRMAAIHNNLITQNAGNDPNGGGGILLGTGAAMYRVYENYIVGNFAAGQGAGISHIGDTSMGANAAGNATKPSSWGTTTDVPSSEPNVAVVDRNTIVFNESFSQGIGTNGGGIFIGSTPPPVGGTVTGTGRVRVSNNLIQGNGASGGDGGGIALLGLNGSNVALFNNTIANNVAAFAGGGIAIQDPGGNGSNVEIVQNTIANNDSLSTAGLAFNLPNPNQSTPMPAGIFVRNTTGNPKVTNSIVWHNRSWYIGQTNGGDFQIPGAAATYGLLPCVTAPTCAGGFWDSGRSGSVAVLAMNGSTTSATGTNPAFVRQYQNTDRRNSYKDAGATTILAPAALDEGGNFIRPQFGPLSLTNLDGTRFSNYHTSSGVAGINLNANVGAGGYGGTGNANVPPALLFDVDPQPRPVAAPHRGVDQVTGFIPPPTAVDDAEFVDACGESCPTLTIAVLANDSPAPLLVTGVSQVVGGTAQTDGVTVTFTPNAGFNGQASFSYGVSGIGGEASAKVTVAVGNPSPFLLLTPSVINFPNVVQGTTSAPKVVTITNTGNESLTITGIALNGDDPTQYTSVSSCPTTLAAGTNCTVSVTFHPTSLGAKQAMLDVGVDAPALSGSVVLSGVGLGAGLAASPSALPFGLQTLNQTSPALSLTLTNGGNSLAEFALPTLVGANPGQFAIVNGCPAMPTGTNRYVVAGGNCAVIVTFRPTSAGAKNATLTVTPTSGPAFVVPVTGTSAAVSVSRSPGSLAFGNVNLGSTSATQPVTVTNNGTAPVQLALTFTGTNATQFSQVGTCPVAPATLASAASCVANVRLAPTGAPGARSGNLIVTPTGNPALAAVTLTGTAVFQPPVVTGPVSGSTVSGNVALAATLASTTGVNRVQFLNGATIIATDTTPANGVTGTWATTSAVNGAAAITARACGNATCTTVLGTSSPAINVTVSNVISVTAPGDGVTVNGAVALTATTTAGVSKVQFVVAGIVVAFDTTPANGVSATWNTTVANNGSQVITARSCSNGGGGGGACTVVATSPSVTVTVSN